MAGVYLMLMDLTMLVASRSTTGTPVSWLRNMFQIRSFWSVHLLVRLDDFPSELLKVLLDVVVRVQIKVDIFEQQMLVEERNDRCEFVHWPGFLVSPPPAACTV
jgi:hypothetical protein